MKFEFDLLSVIAAIPMIRVFGGSFEAWTLMMLPDDGALHLSVIVHCGLNDSALAWLDRQPLSHTCIPTRPAAVVSASIGKLIWKSWTGVGN